MERFRQRYGIALTKKKLQEIILMLMALEAVFAFSYLEMCIRDRLFRVSSSMSNNGSQKIYPGKDFVIKK